MTRNITDVTEMYKPSTPICTCGRVTFPIHCKACGSTSKYSRVSEGQVINIPPLRGSLSEGLGEERNILIKRCVCRYCGHAYFENDDCFAPVLVQKPSAADAKAARAAIQRTGTTALSAADVEKVIEGVKRIAAERAGTPYALPTGPNVVTTQEKWRRIRVGEAKPEDFDGLSIIKKEDTPLLPDELPDKLPDELQPDEPIMNSEEKAEFDKWMKGD